MQAAEDLAVQIGLQPAVCALGVSRAGIYRKRCAQKAPYIASSQRPAPPRTLSEQERQTVLQVLHSDRFIDQAPAEVYATLLDEGSYHCSVRTMYRILENSHEVKERRNQLAHPAYHKPELLATAPNQVWSWDITKLLGPAKWCYFYLYVILDVFSRYAVGWMVAHRESSTLASRLFAATCLREKIEPGQLIIHADRGSSMKSKPVALLFADLGITKTHSRPHVSNDNPFSEAQFKTLKYRPSFPERFENIQHARLFCGPFFDWYNHSHRHAGIGLLTPAMVHFGRCQQVLQARTDVLRAAFRAHSERFVNKIPAPLALPQAAWINKPKPNEAKDPNKNSLNKNVRVSQNH